MKELSAPPPEAVLWEIRLRDGRTKKVMAQTAFEAVKKAFPSVHFSEAEAQPT
jgi:hypothetical protein